MMSNKEILEIAKKVADMIEEELQKIDEGEREEILRAIFELSGKIILPQRRNSFTFYSG